MVDQLSPLGSAFRPGQHGNLVAGAGVVISEPQPGSIVQLAAWPGQEKTIAAAIGKVSGLILASAPGAGAVGAEAKAFGFAPGRFLVVDDAEGLAARYAAAVSETAGTVTDLSHARTAIRISGHKSEWVLAKLYAIDFAPHAFPVGTARSTTHHEVFTQIHRSGAEQFDLYVFRSFARSFWKTLCHAAEGVGYEVM